MATLNFVQICSDIAATLATATGIQYVQDASDESAGISESISEADLPLIQVYPEQWEGTATSTTQANAFMGSATLGVQQTRDATFNVDVYVQVRGSDIAVSMADYVQIAENVSSALEAEVNAPYFGNEQIRAFTYSASRVTFDYGAMQYVGIRFQLSPKVF